MHKMIQCVAECLKCFKTNRKVDGKFWVHQCTIVDYLAVFILQSMVLQPRLDLKIWLVAKWCNFL